jgi:hypothetical protein
MKSVLQDWVMELGLRHQAVLIQASRGCDGRSKFDASKAMNRAIRYFVMMPFDVRHQIEDPTGFMSYDLKNLFEDTKKWMSDLDGYPMHYVMHIIHAFEVIGYEHPDGLVRHHFFTCYYNLVNSLHLDIEQPEQMNLRLNEPYKPKNPEKRLLHVEEDQGAI